MSRAIVLGVTGGIGSGKSLALEYLRGKGAMVVRADDLVSQLWEGQDDQFVSQTTQLLGPQIWCDGIADKQQIATIVFADPGKKQALEALIHPKVRSLMHSFVEEHAEDAAVIAIEVPLLFESGLDTYFDHTVAVVADQEVRLQRAMERDRATPEQIQARMSHQLSDEHRISKADLVWHNTAQPHDLYPQIDRDTDPWFA